MPTVSLNHLDHYLASHGCNQVQDCVIMPSEDENIEFIIYDVLNCKYFISIKKMLQLIRMENCIHPWY